MTFKNCLNIWLELEPFRCNVDHDSPLFLHYLHRCLTIISTVQQSSTCFLRMLSRANCIVALFLGSWQGFASTGGPSILGPWSAEAFCPHDWGIALSGEVVPCLSPWENLRTFFRASRGPWGGLSMEAISTALWFDSFVYVWELQTVSVCWYVCLHGKK